MHDTVLPKSLSLKGKKIGRICEQKNTVEPRPQLLIRLIISGIFNKKIKNRLLDRGG